MRPRSPRPGRHEPVATPGGHGVGLPHLDLEPEARTRTDKVFGQLGVRHVPVDSRFPLAELAEVGSVQDEHAGHVRHPAIPVPRRRENPSGSGAQPEREVRSPEQPVQQEHRVALDVVAGIVTHRVDAYVMSLGQSEQLAAGAQHEGVVGVVVQHDQGGAEAVRRVVERICERIPAAGCLDDGYEVSRVGCQRRQAAGFAQRLGDTSRGARREHGTAPDQRQVVADAMDAVAEACSPHQTVATNPAKDLALTIGDDLPLVWGGSVLAARASRRVAEALREATGLPALAADAGDLVPLIEASRSRDPFADPFDDPTDRRGTTLVVLDDDSEDSVVLRTRGQLLALAERHDVRVHTVRHDAGNDVERYSVLLLNGLFGAAYLSLGLGTTT